MVKSIRTISDYEAAAQEHEILAYEQAVREGRIKVQRCPDCDQDIPVRQFCSDVPGNRHEACFPPGGEK